MSLELSSDPKETEEAGEGAPAEAAVDPEGGEEKPKPAGRKKLFIVIAVVVVAAMLAAGFIVFLKKHKEEAAVEAKETQQEANTQQIFHDMDELIVNLNTEGKSVSFLKLTITLDIKGKDNLDVVLKFMPRIRDVFQIYLRELRPADMQGSVGLYRLREELLLRVNKLIYPAQVNDILFKEVLVQ